MPTTTYLDLITQAAQELNLITRLGGIEDVTMSQFLLDRLTMMVDSWNVKPSLVPWYQQQVFNLVPGQQSYLIGPNAPDWNAPRPIRLDPNATNLLLINPTTVNPPMSIGGYYPDTITVNGISQGQAPYQINVNSAIVGRYPISLFVNQGPSYPYSAATTPLRIPLKVLSAQKWANITLPTLTITFPQACYLDRSIVVGTNSVTGAAYTATRFWVWGVPTTVNQIELFYWYALTIGNLTDNVNAAPGYFRAMVLNLALEVASSFGITPSPLTVQNARDALGNIRELNAPDMSMVQPDAGMPGSRASGYLTRAQFLSGVF
jgi:hypothetical protein